MLVLGLLVFFAAWYNTGKEKKIEPSAPIDPIVQLGKFKSEKEMKRAESLSRQRDIKKELEDSYIEVSGFDSEIKDYERQIMEIVNPKDAKLKITR